MTGDIDIEPVCRGSSETLATTVTDDTMMEAGVGSSPSGTSDTDEYEICCTYGMKAFNLATIGTRISGLEHGSGGGLQDKRQNFLSQHAPTITTPLVDSTSRDQV